MFEHLESGRGQAEIAYKKAEFFLEHLKRLTGQTYRIVLVDDAEEPKPTKKTNPVKEVKRKNEND